LLLFASGYIYLLFNPIIIKPNAFPNFIFNPLSGKEDNTFNKCYENEMQPSDTFKLFEHFDFSKGNWKICILFLERYNVPKNIPQGSFLETTDKEIIEKFRDLSFEYTG
jgi:hypothetical protein